MAKIVNTTTDTQTTSNKDYKKEIKKQKRAAKAVAKKAAAEKRAAEPKIYDILVQFDKRNAKIVAATLEAEKIKPVMISDTYAWIRNSSVEIKEKVCESMSRCGLVYNGKLYKVRVSAMRAKEQILAEKKTKKPTNNTDEAKKNARIERRKKNIENHKEKHTYALTRAERKKAHIVGRKAKLYTYDEKVKGVVRIEHKRGSMNTTLESKIKDRARKAVRSIVKAEKKAEIKPIITAKPKAKTKKAVQTEFALAA